MNAWLICLGNDGKMSRLVSELFVAHAAKSVSKVALIIISFNYFRGVIYQEKVGAFTAH